MHVILMCRSLTTSQRAARILQKAGIYASVTKAPQSANPGGCTYGVKIAQRNLEIAAQLLSAAGIGFEQAPEAPQTGYGVRV